MWQIILYHGDGSHGFIMGNSSKKATRTVPKGQITLVAKQHPLYWQNLVEQFYETRIFEE